MHGSHAKSLIIAVIRLVAFDRIRPDPGPCKLRDIIIHQLFCTSYNTDIGQGNTAPLQLPDLLGKEGKLRIRIFEFPDFWLLSMCQRLTSVPKVYAVIQVIERDSVQ